MSWAYIEVIASHFGLLIERMILRNRQFSVTALFLTGIFAGVEKKKFLNVNMQI